MEESGNKPFYKRWWFVTIAVLFVLAAIGNMREPTESANEKPPAVKAQQPKRQEPAPKPAKPAAPKTVNEYVLDATMAVLADDQHAKFSVVDGGHVTVTIDREGFLSAGMERRSILAKSADLFERIFKADDTASVVLKWRLPATDKYGSKKMTEVVRVELDRATAVKITWKNFSAKNLPDVATEYVEHPGFK